LSVTAAGARPARAGEALASAAIALAVTDEVEVTDDEEEDGAVSAEASCTAAAVLLCSKPAALGVRCPRFERPDGDSAPITAVSGSVGSTLTAGEKEAEASSGATAVGEEGEKEEEEGREGDVAAAVLAVGCALVFFSPLFLPFLPAPAIIAANLALVSSSR
jgi:hypothetical protein